SPVVAILGARQVGKTTLARQVARAAGARAAWLDLEDDRDVARLAEPLRALEPLRGLVVLDEIQRRPELFPALRVLADRLGKPARFLVLGSASPSLLRQGSESLAGRITFHHLPPLSLRETGRGARDTLWLRGGFPRSFLARTDAESHRWRKDLVATFLERDLPQLGIGIPAPTLLRFWKMLAHYHGQVWNASEFARSFGVSDMTVRRYLDVLAATFMIRQLPPWHENLAKRQVKSPKVYFRDSGLLHWLLDAPTMEDLSVHPRVGASWEGFALEEVLKRIGPDGEGCAFWATHAGAELDLLVTRGRRREGFEFKHTAEPAVTASMRVALKDLRLDRLTVVHAGDASYPLGDRLRAVPLERLAGELPPA
ncbi:MAG: ATP-binding protein, partial [bacterium]